MPSISKVKTPYSMRIDLWHVDRWWNCNTRECEAAVCELMIAQIIIHPDNIIAMCKRVFKMYWALKMLTGGRASMPQWPKSHIYWATIVLWHLANVIQCVLERVYFPKTSLNATVTNTGWCVWACRSKECVLPEVWEIEFTLCFWCTWQKKKIEYVRTRFRTNR